MNLTASVSLDITLFLRHTNKIFIFILQSTVASNRGIKATEMILKTLEKVDAPEVKKSVFSRKTFLDNVTYILLLFRQWLLVQSFDPFVCHPCLPAL